MDNHIISSGLSTEQPPFVDDSPFFYASSTKRRYFVDDQLFFESLSTKKGLFVDGKLLNDALSTIRAYSRSTNMMCLYVAENQGIINETCSFT